jgi:glucose/arabinose dehydrogenase
MKKFCSLLSIVLFSSGLIAQNENLNVSMEVSELDDTKKVKPEVDGQKGSATFQIASELIVTGINSPTTITNAGDERLFVTEQAGVIRVFDRDGNLESTPFMNIQNRVQDVGGEQGLLGLAFEANFCETGRFYVNYTANDGGLVTRISRFTVLESNPELGDPNSEEVLIQFDQDFGNHNGGHIEFGPDGFLYIATGDGGSGGDPNNRAQDITSFLGKILRIDVSPETGYTVPTDNPFAEDDFGVDEIWSYGWRNPWKFAFDSETGGKYIADVGQNEWEEVNFEPADASPGLNYGWRCYEASSNYNLQGCNDVGTYVFPMVEYNHNESGFSHCSVTGGRVYRGLSFPDFDGYYFYTDFCSGAFWAARDISGVVLLQQFGTIGQSFVRTFGEDIWGEIYFGNNNGIYRLVNPNFDIIPPIVRNGDVLESSLEGTNYEWLFNGESVVNGDFPSVQVEETGSYTLLLTLEGSNCPIEYSIDVTSLDTDQMEVNELEVFPNPTSGNVVIDLGRDYFKGSNLRIVALDGRVVKDLRVQNKRLEFNLSAVSKGIYLVELTDNSGNLIGVSKLMKE